MRKRNAARQAGFTLVEIAIVLVIIGLILGGVLKGQELVTSARVRNIADQQNAIKAAFFAFQDRYKALPGDYPGAGANIPGLVGSTANGDGDGFVAYTATGSASPNPNEANESVWAFLHMAAAGFISCAACIQNGNATGSSTATNTSTNSPVNAYGGALALQYDAVYGNPTNESTTNPAHNLKTGPNIPSSILAEVDSKLDDGSPYSGSFQFSKYAGNGTAAPTAAGCVTTPTAGIPIWNRQTPSTNCGAAYTF